MRHLTKANVVTAIIVLEASTNTFDCRFCTQMLKTPHTTVDTRSTAAYVCVRVPIGEHRENEKNNKTRHKRQASDPYTQIHFYCVVPS